VTDDFGTVSGGRGNRAGDNAGTNLDRPYATVGGGQDNTASGEEATVGGGYSNQANAEKATVAGGWDNTASGEEATVGGGVQNTASGWGSTVSGGLGNTASGWGASVSGGGDNIASGVKATVAGGEANLAQGNWSFAAGMRATAYHEGAFVWADSYWYEFASTANNQFSARTTGGARFVSAIDGSGNPTAGVQMAAGGNSWSGISDRNVKANFTPVDGQEILDRLADIPIETWNLKSQDESIRHIGPMAQDFYAAFSVGEDELYINNMDADGVALAAIQGLYELVQEKDAEIAALEQRLAEVEQGAGGSSAASQSSSSSLPATWLLLSALVLGALATGLSGLVLAQRRLAGGRR
jgi:hypothetical protein